MTQIHTEPRFVTRIVAVDAENDQLTISTAMPGGSASLMMPMGMGNDLTITVVKPHDYTTGTPMTLGVSV